MDQVRFTKRVVEIVAKRAANVCSNPDCQALTTGPADQPNKAVSVGEAAHIFGARPGSARFRPEMGDDRGDTVNAIWLCCTCHKLVDSDAVQFPADLLFEWKRTHEQVLLSKIGKTGSALRERVLSRKLEPFKSATYLAQQIVIDKPDHWEYKLMAELLRSMAVPVIDRWHDLERGLYTKPSDIVPLNGAMAWIKARLAELQRISSVVSGLINGGMQESWGPEGQPGSETEILRVCGLFKECCDNILIWEERVRFASLPYSFDDVQENFFGTAGRVMNAIAKVPAHMTEIFERANPSGVHTLSIEIDLPEGWTERHEAAMERALEDARERTGENPFGV